LWNFTNRNEMKDDDESPDESRDETPLPEQQPYVYRKSTKFEIKQRVTKVAELVMQGLTGAQILQYATEKLHWQIKERQIWEYIKRANEMFAEEAQTKTGAEFGKGLRRLNFLFANCLKIQDYKGALAMQREINEMMGFRNKYEVKEEITNKELHITVDSSETAKEFKRMKDELSKPDQRIRKDSKSTD